MAKTNEISFIAAALAARHGVEWREAENFLTCLFALIGDGLREDRIVKIKGLGTFKVVDVRERESIDVNTGERIVIGSRTKVTFTPDNVLKDLVNKPFAQFETVVLNEGVTFDDEPAAGDVPAVVGDAPVPDDTGRPEEHEEREPSDTPEESDAEADAAREVAGDDAGETGATGTSAQDDETEDIVADVAGEDSPERDESGTDMPADADDADADDADAADDDDDGGDDDGGGGDGDSGRHSLRWLWVTLLVLVVAAAMFVLGYCVGRGGKIRLFASPEDSVTAVPQTPEKQDTAVTNIEETADTAGNAAADTLTTPVTDTPDVAAETDTHDGDERLQRARLMVAKGAYVITGTAETITVPPGKTMQQISRYYFGDGMECYLQVHNNVMEVSEGMTLKIPVLKNKKARK